MKVKMKMKNRSHSYDMNRPGPRQEQGPTKTWETGEAELAPNFTEVQKMFFKK